MADPDEVFAALVAAFPRREVRRSGDEAVLMLRWPPQLQLFGVPVDLTRTDRRLDWDQPAEGLPDWLDSVGLWLMEDVENGFVYRARRRQVDDYIELRGPSWPTDHRFYTDVVGPRDAYAWLRVRFMEADGLDCSAALARRDARTLVAWVTAYENNSSGSPYVAQATVVRSVADGGLQMAELDHVEFVADAPATLVLDTIRTATHAAADSGAARVTTTLALPHLDLAGFRPDGDTMAVDTRFLAEDPEGADALYARTLADPGPWGCDRDQAGRYLPKSRLGRLLHRARYGATGARPKIYVG